MLDISRIEAGHLLLGDVIQEALDLVHPLAEKWTVRFAGVPPEAVDRYVLADRQRVKQALLNFLSNAAKFNRPEGTVTVSVEDVSGERLRLKVIDTGLGIPSEKMARLFTPFDRLGAEDSGVEGTGLGLALTRRLVEAMGGTVGADSAVDRGSIFWVELPRVEGPAATAQLPTEASTQTSGPAGTVLCIGDNLPNLRLVEGVLAHRPAIKLLSAMQGGLGLELATEHRPGLTLLDLQFVQLPIDLRQTDAAKTARAARPSPISERAVLIVDDDRDVAETLWDFLRLDGHPAEIVADGTLALEKLRDGRYDLILSDVKMPELDGPRFYTQLERRHPEFLRRVAFLTGDTLNPETTAFLERTRVPAMAKPFTLEQVRRVLQQVAQER